MIADHFQSFKALIESLAGIPEVHTNIRRSTSGDPIRANYVVVWPPTIPSLDDGRYLASQRADSSARFRFDVMPVGTTPDAVMAFTDTILAATVGHVFTVPGRRIDAARLVPGVEEGGAHYEHASDLHYTDFTIELRSSPA